MPGSPMADWPAPEVPHNGWWIQSRHQDTVSRPDVLVMDEPINGLDPDGIAWIRSFLANAASEGATVLLSSHHMAELAETADDIVMIGGGRILGQGSIGDFLSHLDETGYYLESPDPEILLAAMARRGFRATRERAGILVHHTNPTELASVALESARVFRICPGGHAAWKTPTSKSWPGAHLEERNDHYRVTD